MKLIPNAICALAMSAALNPASLFGSTLTLDQVCEEMGEVDTLDNSEKSTTILSFDTYGGSEVLPLPYASRVRLALDYKCSSKKLVWVKSSESLISPELSAPVDLVKAYGKPGQWRTVHRDNYVKYVAITDAEYDEYELTVSGLRMDEEVEATKQNLEIVEVGEREYKVVIKNMPMFTLSYTGMDLQKMFEEKELGEFFDHLDDLKEFESYPQFNVSSEKELKQALKEMNALVRPVAYDVSVEVQTEGLVFVNGYGDFPDEHNARFLKVKTKVKHKDKKIKSFISALKRKVKTLSGDDKVDMNNFISTLEGYSHTVDNENEDVGISLDLESLEAAKAILK